MNNLLFSALCLALLYYFFFYLPSQKKLNAHPPLSKATQTEESEQIKYLSQELKKKSQTIQALKSDLQDYKNEASVWRQKQKIYHQQSQILAQKELIQEAIEFHHNFASSFIPYANRSVLVPPEIVETERKKLAAEFLTTRINQLTPEAKTAENIQKIKTELRDEFDNLAHSQATQIIIPNNWTYRELTPPTEPKLILHEGKTIRSPAWVAYERDLVCNAFVKQSKRNQRIIKACQTLLNQLKELN